MWEYNGGWETENESFDTWVESWVGELESWNLKPSDGDGGDREQRGCEWVCEWDFEIVLGSEHGSVRERGDREHIAKRERKAKIEKQKCREFRLFCLKAWVETVRFTPVFYNFFLMFNLNFGLNRPYQCRYRLNQPISAVLADMTWFGVNRPELVLILSVSGNEKKKKKKWRGTDARAAASPAALRVELHWTLVQRLCSRVGAS